MMFGRMTSRLAWAAGVLLFAGVAHAQPPPTGGTGTAPGKSNVKSGGIGTPGSPGYGRMSIPTGTSGTNGITGTGWSNGTGVMNGTGTGLGRTNTGFGTAGAGFGQIPQLPPAIELQVLLEAVAIAEALGVSQSFASEFDALMFFIDIYAMRYMAAVRALAGAGTGNFGLGGTGGLGGAGGLGGLGTTRP